MAWFTAGPQATTTDQQVLADTGPVTAAREAPCNVIVTGAVQVSVVLERRDAANAATLSSQFIRVPPNDTRATAMGTIFVAANERLRVLSSGVHSGPVHVSVTF